MSEPRDFDVIVIGSGAGGLTAAIGLGRFGKQVALVERGAVGGDCTNTGCIPSKRLIHLAGRRRDDRDAAAVFADVRAVRDGLSAKERAELVADPNITLVDGNARLASPTSVTVSGAAVNELLRARHIVIATGSRPQDLEIPGLPPERRLTNETLFELETAPAHLAIVGAGAIGLEMAAAFTRLGTTVTLVDVADRVAPTAVPEASEAVASALRDMGVDIRLGGRVIDYVESRRGLRIGVGERNEEITGVDSVLVAIGRVPNVEELGLDEVAVEHSAAGIRVDSWGRTSVSGIWAVGDVTPGSHQTHAANVFGRRIIQRIAIPWLPPTGRPPLIPSAVFCEPEIAWVGLSRHEIERRFAPGAVTRVIIDLADQDRGLTDGVAHGFVMIDAVRLTGRILAATVVGPKASELVATITLAMSRGTSLLRLSRMSYAYPTFAAAIGAAADEFARMTLPHLRRESFAYVRNRFRTGRGGRTS